jgi:hypothetical protein
LNRSDRQLRPNGHAEGNDWESDNQNGMLNRVGVANHLQITRMSDEQSDARKSPVGREFETLFLGGDCVIAGDYEVLGLQVA